MGELRWRTNVPEDLFRLVHGVPTRGRPKLAPSGPVGPLFHGNVGVVLTTPSYRCERATGPVRVNAFACPAITTIVEHEYQPAMVRIPSTLHDVEVVIDVEDIRGTDS
jgi:hypothetical protein